MRGLTVEQLIERLLELPAHHVVVVNGRRPAVDVVQHTTIEGGPTVEVI